MQKAKLLKQKRWLTKIVYALFGSGTLYAAWQFLSTPRTAEWMEQRRLYAMEAWMLFGVLAIFILINLHYQIQDSGKSSRK